jgi:hypothetical protein
MADEHKALLNNNTWSLVPRPPRANVVIGKWIYRHKFHSNGTLARRKAHWVVRGYSQRLGINYNETFSPVTKPKTIRPSSALPYPMIGLFVSLMSKMHFSMTHLMKCSTVSSPLVLLMLLIRLTCVAYTSPCMV